MEPAPRLASDDLPPRRRRAHLAVALAVSVAVALLALCLVSRDAPCDGDEATHLRRGLVLREDALRGDLAAFARHTAKGRYPFLHGWGLAGVLAVAGPSVLAARATSAVLLGLSAGLAGLLLVRVRPRTHPAWGLAAGAFVGLAPENVANGVLVMPEVPGLFLVLLAVWLHRRLAERPANARGLAVGLAITALFLLKFPYAAYVGVPVAAYGIVRARGRPRAILGSGGVWIYAVPAVVFVAWLALPPTRQGLRQFLAVGPSTRLGPRDPTALPGVDPALALVYLRALATRLSPGVAAGVAGALGAIVLLLRETLHARLVVVGGVVLTVITLTLTFRAFGVDRFLVPVAGLVAVAAIAGLAEAAALAARRAGRTGAIAAAALLVVPAAGAAWHARGLPDEARRSVETGEAEATTLDAILAVLPRPANVLLVGAWDQLSETALEVRDLCRRPGASYLDLDVKAIRRDKRPPDPAGVRRWVEATSRHRPPGGGPRARVIVLLRPVRETPLFDRSLLDRARAAVEEEVRGLDPLATGSGGAAGFAVYRLPGDG